MWNSFIFPAASLTFPEFLFILLGNQAVFPEAWIPLPAPDPTSSSRKASGSLFVLPGHTRCHFFMAHVALLEEIQEERQTSSPFWFCLNHELENKVPRSQKQGAGWPVHTFREGVCHSLVFKSHLRYWSTDAIRIMKSNLKRQRPEGAVTSGDVSQGHTQFNWSKVITMTSTGSVGQAALCKAKNVMAQMLKNLPAMQETQVLSLGQEDPLEKEMATLSSIPAWKATAPGSQRVPWSRTPLSNYYKKVRPGGFFFFFFLKC